MMFTLKHIYNNLIEKAAGNLCWVDWFCYVNVWIFNLQAMMNAQQELQTSADKGQ